MQEVTVEHNPSPDKMDVMGVEAWTVWTKESSTFPWTYDSEASCYSLVGEAIMAPDGSEAVTLPFGDPVIFDNGLTCTWDIIDTVEKHI